MQKKLIYILFILCINLSFSQQYELRIKNFDFGAQTTRGRCGTNEMWLDVYLQNGSRDRVIQSDDGTNLKVPFFERTYSSAISEIVFYAFIHSKDLRPYSCNGGSASIDKKIVVNDCLKGMFVRHSEGKRNYESAQMDISFEYEISPVTKLTQTSYEIGYDDFLTLEIHNESEKIASHLFKYEYLIAPPIPSPIFIPNHWKSLDIKYQNRKNVKFKLRDFLPSSVIGNRIMFRTISSCDGEYKSNVVTYYIQKSLPNLSSHTLAKTTCFDTNDGKITLQFDRALEAGEAMSFNLLNSYGHPIPLPNVQNITSLDKNNTFTIENLHAGEYRLRITGKNNGNDAYSAYASNPLTFSIRKNLPVDFSVTKTDIFCHNGQDGQIFLTASGGTDSGYKYQINNQGEWISFSNGNTHTIQHLKQGTYTINVQDGNGCMAKIQHHFGRNIILGEPKNTKITLTQPQNPLTIALVSHKEPTFYGASDGIIIVEVRGGTIFNNNTYLFEWKNSKNQIVGQTKTSFSDAFYISLENIPADTYFLTIKDKNYSTASDKGGCSIDNYQFVLSQPAPLKAEIQLIKPISCHSENEFGNEKDQNSDGQRDESQDGILKIIASGGIPFSSANPYKYTWKKQKNDGSWQTLSFDTDTATGLSAGNYAINIEDANGIILGEYDFSTTTLIKPTDATYSFAQPEKLTLSLQKTDATCKGNDGLVQVTVSGGTPPYSYKWSNGEKTARLENVVPQPYFVTITDSRGCSVEGSTTVNQPNPLKIKEIITPLLCHNASDAKIEVLVEGGTPPYQYQWSNGATTPVINNLSSGNYQLKITDHQGCNYFKDYTIENPPLFSIDLGKDRTLCNGQTLELSAKIDDSQAVYLWISDNGFSSNQPDITVSETGIYQVKVVNKNGCVAADEIRIDTTTTHIAAEFLLTTQSYENQEVILVNTSTPKGESTQWLVPDDKNIEIISQDDNYITLKFKHKGEYSIGIKQTQGDCFEVFYKKIIVEESNGFDTIPDTNQAFIKEFWVAPIPNDGNFKVKVSLEKPSLINMRLYTMSGQLISSRKIPSNQEHLVDFELKIAAGTYILVVETPFQQLSKKIIIH